MSKSKPQEKTYDYSIDEVCMSVLGVNRFYATILSKMVKLETNPAIIPTAAVGFNKFGKLCLYYSKDFLLGQPLEKAQGTIVHEVLHVFFRHLIRFKIDESNKHLHKIYNMGMDMAINQYIPHLPDGVMYPDMAPYNFPKDKSADFYIEELKKLAENQNKCPKCGSKMQQQGQGQDEQDQDGQGDSQDEQDQDGQDEQDQDGQGNDQQDQSNQDGQGGQDECPNCGHEQPSNGQTLDSHDMWDKVISEDGLVQDARDYDIDPEYEVTTAVMKSIKECKEYGSLPKFVEKEMESHKQIKRHNWKKDLKVFVNTVLTSKKKLSQKRVNRRLHDADYILPGKKKSRNPKLLVVRDTSGSEFDDETQAEFINEILQIAKNSQVFVCDCDTRVHQTYQVRNESDVRAYLGGGGTAFEPAFEEARKLKVDGILYLTDTYGSFPSKKDIGKYASSTIWVTFDQANVSLPFGKHVNIDTSDK